MRQKLRPFNLEKDVPDGGVEPQVGKDEVKAQAEVPSGGKRYHYTNFSLSESPSLRPHKGSPNKIFCNNASCDS